MTSEEFLVANGWDKDVSNYVGIACSLQFKIITGDPALSLTYASLRGGGFLPG